MLRNEISEAIWRVTLTILLISITSSEPLPAVSSLNSTNQMGSSHVLIVIQATTSGTTTSTSSSATSVITDRNSLKNKPLPTRPFNGLSSKVNNGR